MRSGWAPAGAGRYGAPRVARPTWSSGPSNFTVRRQGVLMTLCDYCAPRCWLFRSTLAACATENISSSGGANS